MDNPAQARERRQPRRYQQHTWTTDAVTGCCGRWWWSLGRNSHGCV